MKKLLIVLLAISVLAGLNVEAAGLRAPSNLQATAASSSQINLTWQDNCGRDEGFRIERSTDGINFSEIAQVEASIVSYSDTNLSSATTYYYRIRAFKVQQSGKITYSFYSNKASATTL